MFAQLLEKRLLIGEKILSQEDLAHLKGTDTNFVSDEESNEETASWGSGLPANRLIGSPGCLLPRAGTLCFRA